MVLLHHLLKMLRLDLLQWLLVLVLPVLWDVVYPLLLLVLLLPLVFLVLLEV
jgi:hypothetical protein